MEHSDLKHGMDSQDEHESAEQMLKQASYTEGVHESEMVSGTPPSVLVEPEVLDPFIVDDEEDDEDGDDEQNSPRSHSQLRNTLTISADGDEGETPAAEDEIALAQSTILESSLNLDKPVPPPPSEAVEAGELGIDTPEVSRLAYNDEGSDGNESESEDDVEPPELYLPGLILPTMFLPIPNVRFVVQGIYLLYQCSFNKSRQTRSLLCSQNIYPRSDVRHET
jgi:hypothetical protein